MMRWMLCVLYCAGFKLTGLCCVVLCCDVL